MVAFLATISLDYLNFKKGQVHYLGWNKIQVHMVALASRPAKSPAEEFSLADYLRHELKEAGLAENRLSLSLEENGNFQAFLELDEQEFKKIKPQLLSNLKKKKVKTKLSETKTDAGKVLVTIQMKPPQGPGGQLLLSYRIPVELARPSATPEKPSPGVPPITVAIKTQKKVAVVIDDMGNDLDFLQELINLEVPLTVAVLPNALYASQTAQLAQEKGLEVIVHLPLEALNGQASYTGADGIIRASMSKEEIRSILERDLSILPQAVGLNNHMGSRATADSYLMEVILDFLKEKNLFFLDSKTTSRSIAYDLAIQKKIPALSRNVFLDADDNRHQIKERLSELLRYALKNGQAVGIGHPFPETLEALRSYKMEAERLGLEPVKLSSLLQ
ncbi:MAG: divergent polysaccharide deacetylase family protein [Candidatus Aminicenantes bacterium]|nr:divergent polysaccharide deacetylase family protein [Candidatus Aminicenantes bacterium]